MRSETELLAEVHRHLDDDAPRLVYADWLLEQRDPAQIARGELIALQCRSARSPVDEEGADRDRERVQALLAAHGARWFHPLQTVGKAREYRRGFLWSLFCEPQNVPGDWRDAINHPNWATVEEVSFGRRQPKWCASLLLQPMTRRLRKIDGLPVEVLAQLCQGDVRIVEDVSCDNIVADLDEHLESALAARAGLPRLRSLFMLLQNHRWLRSTPLLDGLEELHGGLLGDASQLGEWHQTFAAGLRLKASSVGTPGAGYHFRRGSDGQLSSLSIELHSYRSMRAPLPSLASLDPGTLTHLAIAVPGVERAPPEFIADLEEAARRFHRLERFEPAWRPAATTT